MLCEGNQIGVTLRNATAYNQVFDNLISGTAFESAIRVEVSQSGPGPNILRGNNLDGAMSGAAISSAAALVIPDWAEFVQLNGTTAVTSLQTTSQSFKAGTITSVVVNNAGSGYDPANKPTVTVSGTGSGASLQAEISRDGTLIGITVLNPGSGYTSATVVVSPPSSGVQALVSPTIGVVDIYIPYLSNSSY